MITGTGVGAGQGERYRQAKRLTFDDKSLTKTFTLGMFIFFVLTHWPSTNLMADLVISMKY